MLCSVPDGMRTRKHVSNAYIATKAEVSAAEIEAKKEGCVSYEGLLASLCADDWRCFIARVPGLPSTSHRVPHPCTWVRLTASSSVLDPTAGSRLKRACAGARRSQLIRPSVPAALPERVYDIRYWGESTAPVMESAPLSSWPHFFS